MQADEDPDPDFDPWPVVELDPDELLPPPPEDEEPEELEREPNDLLIESDELSNMPRIFLSASFDDILTFRVHTVMHVIRNQQTYSCFLFLNAFKIIKSQ